MERIRTVVYPPQPTKKDDAIRFGLLGASDIAPMALINPARSHAEVVIAAVAARDEGRARAYAKKHGIPIVHKGYQELIDDPSINAIYIPLPNGLHYEWALKSLQKGKHVLLEKPSVSNSTQASALFLKPPLPSYITPRPVLLEAFHTRFHPAFQRFLGLVERNNIENASVTLNCPKYVFSPDNIRFQSKLAGGALMDMGTYGVLALRCVFGKEPVECVDVSPRYVPKGKGCDEGCEEAMMAKWRWECGAIGELDVDLRRGVRGFGEWLRWIPWISTPSVDVRHREELLPDDGGDGGVEHVVVKTVTLWNMIAPWFWHSIVILTRHTSREVRSKKVVKSWTEKEVVKAYTWEEGDKSKGEAWWTTYRYQLEAFVDRVKGRESGVWMDGEDSVRQMEMIDGTYEKAGLPKRPGDV